MDNEKEIEQLTDFLIENGVFNNLVCRQDYVNPDALIYECCRQVAELVINLGYRKADTVRKQLAKDFTHEFNTFVEVCENEISQGRCVDENEAQIALLKSMIALYTKQFNLGEGEGNE